MSQIHGRRIYRARKMVYAAIELIRQMPLVQFVFVFACVDGMYLLLRNKKLVVLDR